jgi:class 3 adenylate cyclase
MAEQRRVVTVLIADIEGSTALRSTVGDTAGQARIDAAIAAIGDTVGATGGAVVKELGDGVRRAAVAGRSAAGR